MHYRVSVYNYFHKRFREIGWDWHVITNELQPENQILPRFSLDLLPFSFSSYRQRIQELNPDVVILFLHLKDRVLWPLLHWLKAKGTPVALWTKTKNLDDPDNFGKNLLFRYVNTLSDGLIVYSRDLLSNLTDRQRRKAFVANNTINQEDFPSVTESKESIRRSFGVPFEKVALFVGRMNVGGGRKRVDCLIDIFKNLEGRNAGLVIVGSGLGPELRARLDTRTMVHLGEIQDPQNLQIARVFSMADICVIPGHVGLGLNQALYFGLPVVTMAGVHPPEICNLHPGQNGYIVPAGDIAALKDRILHLLDDDVTRHRLSAAARSSFMREASVEAMFHGFQECVKFLGNHS